MLNEIELSQSLIRFKSFSGNSPQVINFLSNYLQNLGFKCDILEFDGDNSYSVNNLHAIYNPKNSNKIIYFAGHTDVVATGNLNAWTHDPFAATIMDGKLFGRGASDMKCAIACFIVAAQEFIQSNPDFGIGLLITNDEENDSINGTKKVLEWMQKRQMPISACIVGEPTNPNQLGEMLKIGRRGSISFNVKIKGKQGHVAYADIAVNPITTLVNLLKILKDHKFDQGNEYFSPTNLEVTSITSENLGGNVIPSCAEANFNIRFNNFHNTASIIDLIDYACKKTAQGMNANYELTSRASGDSFLCNRGNLAKISVAAVEKICAATPVLGTTGGTSDARFIKDYTNELIECGLVNETAHKIDEFAYLSQITKLKEIYLEILKNF